MFQFRLPDPGEGLVEAEIIRWMVAEGDTVKVNDIIVEIETSKSLVELPAPVAGTISALLVPEGTTVEVGTPIVSIDDGSATASPSDAGPAAAAPDDGGDVPGPNLVGYGPSGSGSRRRRRRPTEANGHQVHEDYNAGYQQSEHGRRADEVTPGGPVVAEPHGDPLPEPGQAPRGTDIVPARGTGPKLAKPPVRHLARHLGVDLETVAGTGPDGQITRGDVEAAAAMQTLASGRVMSEDEAAANGQFGQGHQQEYAGGRFGEQSIGSESYIGEGAGFGGSPFTADAGGDSGFGASFRHGAAGGERREPIRGVRKVTAQAMVDSVSTHVHVTEWVTVDVTATMEMVERIKARREFAGLRISPLLLHAKAVCLAMEATPVINASWDEENQEIVYHEDVNLGIAAATPRGLIVPNVKDADLLPLADLARAIADLTATAREGRTQPADMAGGTITITNVGVFGVDSGTPILNRGESAIMALGAVRRMPWVVTGSDGTESVEPRWVTQLAVSFDHRLVDGELGSRYLADVAAILSDPTRALVWG